MEFLGTLLLAFIAAFGAVLLDRRFAHQDLRRDVYLEWLQLVDTQKVRFKESQMQAADPDRLAIQFADDFIRVRNRLGLLAPEWVTKKIVAYQKAAEQLAKQGVNGDRDPDVVFDAIDQSSERAEMIAAMRRDIRGRWRRGS